MREPYARTVDPHVVISGSRDLPGEIYRNLRAAILDGHIVGGERVPATRELAVRLNVSRTTVAAAYDRLISEGYATGRVGSGTYVEANVATRDGWPAQPRRALRPRRAWESVPLPAVFRVEHPEFGFRAGVPDARLFPYDELRRLTARQFRSPAVGSGVYGEPAGHLGLREAIARHIGVSRGVRAVAEDIIVTNGTQQAVDIIARVLLKPRDRVAVEDPGYSPFACCSRRSGRGSRRCPSMMKDLSSTHSRPRPGSCTSPHLTSFRSACRCRCRAGGHSLPGPRTTTPRL